MSKVIGIYGTIGSGKSTVSRRIEEKYGFSYVDCDNLGHIILEKQETKDQLLQLFGLPIFTKDGLIDRKRLSQVVFDDSQLKSKLEAILWPKMTIRLIELIQQKCNVVLEAAILYTAGWNNLCHYTLFIETSDEKRQEYLKKRNVSKKHWEQILKVQQEIENDKKYATFTIQNIGSYQELFEQVDEVMILIQKSGMKQDQPK